MPPALLLLHLLHLLRTALASTADVVVTTALGRVIGLETGPKNRSPVYSFRGIPYALPPLDHLRWKAPVPRGPWTDEWDARQFRWACPQLGTLRPYSKEDCLYLNIWTPLLGRSRLPVMVWLHGGEFDSGSGMLDNEGVGNFVRRGVVLVSLNYRLGPFAFFSTKTSTGTGNLALLDQLAALHWLQAHILHFGGDPGRVTLLGSGAGAAAASLHSLLPASQSPSPITPHWTGATRVTELFNRLILQSGSAHGPGLVDDAMNDAVSRRLAFNAGCSNFDTWEADPAASLDCLNARTTDDILHFGVLPLAYGSAEAWQWSFRVDGELIPAPVSDLVHNRRPFDAILGLNKDEYGAKVYDLLRKDASLKRHFSPATLAADIAHMTKLFPPSRRLYVQTMARAVYLDAFDGDKLESDSDFWMSQTVKLYTEGWVGGPIFQEASSLKMTGSKVYLYQFDFLSPNALWSAPIRGVFSEWEVGYVFGSPGNVSGLGADNFRATEEDWAVAGFLGDMWTDFVLFGNPSLAERSYRWAPVQLDGDRGQATDNFLSLTASPSMRNGFCPRCVSLWAALAPPLGDADARYRGRLGYACHLDACYGEGYYFGVWILLTLLLLLLLVLVGVLCVFDYRSTGAYVIEEPPPKPVSKTNSPSSSTFNL